MQFCFSFVVISRRERRLLLITCDIRYERMWSWSREESLYICHRFLHLHSLFVPTISSHLTACLKYLSHHLIISLYHFTDLIDLRFSSFSFSSLLAPLDSTGLPFTGASSVLMDVCQGIPAVLSKKAERRIVSECNATQTLDNYTLYLHGEGDWPPMLMREK